MSIQAKYKLCYNFTINFNKIGKLHMIDQYGYRYNVGIILLNHENKVFWAKRRGQPGWQFPQGGISSHEDVETAMLRELREETGLAPYHVKLLAKTKSWLYYDVPVTAKSTPRRKLYRGQKQIWCLLRFVGQDYHINLKYNHNNEFDEWQWIDYWQPIEEIVAFKRDVYHKALHELSLHINN